jgi:putative oxidoreductase
MTLDFLGRYRDAGLFVLRVGIGILFLKHGWPKISNPDMWQNLGGAVGAIGFTPPAAIAKALGFMAALAEFGGGICLILGFLFRPACILLAGTMAIALTYHVKRGDELQAYELALAYLILFFSLILIGPGKISIDRS